MARVLLAEDEFLIRLMLAEELAAAGHNVVEAESGDDALAKSLSGSGCDVLVTDIQMPGALDGLALAARLRERQPGLQVVYVTGRPEIMAKLGKLGTADRLVRKPFAPLEVVAVVDALLAAAAG